MLEDNTILEDAPLNLDQLFTITDYRTQTIHIPYYDPDEDGDALDLQHVTTTTAQEDQQSIDSCSPHKKSLSLTLCASPAATTDVDLTGQIVWPVSILLSHYLASARGGRRVEQGHVVELGAGTGLPGLVAAHCGADQVVVTDGNDLVVDLLQRNIVTASQCHTDTNVSKNDILSTASSQNTLPIQATPLMWGNVQQVRDVLTRLRNRVDVVLAADVVQWPAVLEPLLHTVKALMWRRHDSNNEINILPPKSDKDAVFLLGIVNRANDIYQEFLNKAQALGFIWKSIPPDTFLKDGVVPPSCREFGGRVVEIIELKLVNDSQAPVLLQPHAHDIIVGTEYSSTALLPC
jgi:predicted nicotinamide N-methyase